MEAGTNGFRSRPSFGFGVITSGPIWGMAEWGFRGIGRTLD